MAKSKSKSSKKKISNKKTTNKKRNIIIIVLLLLLIGGGVGYKLINKSNESNLIGGNFLPEGKDAKKMSKEELDKAAQDAVDESQFTLNILSEASFPDGKSSGNIYIKNPTNNAYPISVEVVENESGDVIYESGAIQPGEEITEGTLSKALVKGNYVATAKVSIYDPETKEYKGQTSAEMNIEVKN